MGSFPSVKVWLISLLTMYLVVDGVLLIVEKQYPSCHVVLLLAQIV